MGPLAGRPQVRDVGAERGQAARGGGGGVWRVRYACRSSVPILSVGHSFPHCYCTTNRPFERTAPHEVEAFGPVNTVMPYASLDEAVALAKLGRGSLVGSLFTADPDTARNVVLGTAAPTTAAS